MRWTETKTGDDVQAGMKCCINPFFCNPKNFISIDVRTPDGEKIVVVYDHMFNKEMLEQTFEVFIYANRFGYNVFSLSSYVYPRSAILVEGIDYNVQ